MRFLPPADHTIDLIEAGNVKEGMVCAEIEKKSTLIWM